jgi:hypothetical protein
VDQQFAIPNEWKRECVTQFPYSLTADRIRRNSRTGYQEYKIRACIGGA